MGLFGNKQVNEETFADWVAQGTLKFAGKPAISSLVKLSNLPQDNLETNLFILVVNDFMRGIENLNNIDTARILKRYLKSVYKLGKTYVNSLSEEEFIKEVKNNYNEYSKIFNQVEKEKRSDVFFDYGRKVLGIVFGLDEKEANITTVTVAAGVFGGSLTRTIKLVGELNKKYPIGADY